jgi:thiamine biosynthesis lipoprotein
VLAPTAGEADALSTAFYLLGTEASAAYVAAHPQIGALFVEKVPTGGSPRIVTLGLTEDDFQPHR